MEKPTKWSGDNAPTPLNPPEVYVPKDSPVIHALGALQELSAALGLARSFLRNPVLSAFDKMLRETQRHLYILKCDIASMSDEEVVNGKKIPRPDGGEVRAIDENIAKLEALMGSKPDRFILEGGAPEAASLFLANEVARRAERLFINLPNTLGDEYANLEPKAKACQQYLNHLSFQLYLMARVINRSLGLGEESISTDPVTGVVTVTPGAEMIEDA